MVRTRDPLKEHLLFDSSCSQILDYIATKYLKTIQITIVNFSILRFFDFLRRRAGIANPSFGTPNGRPARMTSILEDIFR